MGFLLHLPAQPTGQLLVDKADATRVVEYKGKAYIEEVYKPDRKNVRGKLQLQDSVHPFSFGLCSSSPLLCSCAQLKPLPGSHITCFLNGESLGPMFEDLMEGFYAPAVSLYYGGRVCWHTRLK